MTDTLTFSIVTFAEAAVGRIMIGCWIGAGFWAEPSLGLGRFLLELAWLLLQSELSLSYKLLQFSMAQCDLSLPLGHCKRDEHPP